MPLMCPDCFGESVLRRRIEEVRPSYPSEKCSYHPTKKGIPAQAVAAIIDVVIRGNFSHGSYNSMLDEHSGDDLQELLYGLVHPTSDDICIAVKDQLIEDDDYWPPDGDEAFYAEDLSYTRQDISGFHHSQIWRTFCDGIIHSQRFFNSEAKKLVAEIFDGIHLQRDHHKNAPVYQLAPGDAEATIWRARLVADEDAHRVMIADPGTHLGPPPPRKRRAGRMNPAGIGAFYGAFDIDTCTAELRPIVGSRILGAQFVLRRPIYVLDTTRFETPIKPMSLFNKDDIQRREQWQFMASFMNTIALPISPNDEHLDYIPTQAVAEYLLNHHEFYNRGEKARIEAVIYRSAQLPAGKNIVLRGDAGKVWFPPPKEGPGKDWGGFASVEYRFSNRNPRGLQVVEGSVKTLVVDAASYPTHEVDTRLFSTGAEDDDIPF
jgi:hypothetical protein